MREEIIIAGSGGQGILFAGELLAQAAMNIGKEVSFFPSYGAEIRGGSANCTVVISDKEIGSPVVFNPSSIIILNNFSLNCFLPRLKKGGLLVINSSLVNTEINRQDIEIVRIPASEIAEKKVGNLKTTNLVILGKYLGKKRIIPMENMLKSIKTVLNGEKELISLNSEALQYGYEYPLVVNSVNPDN
ncbi:MAG TPA: 2-oxoacid:ferredoxin oxidoreductase subunit gamma [Elusimicrobia bacterium]|jgi:2-oxoglutarate ferredoxin oxidoreductase subunit gamma|nr:2-oxoacid:ferredoxin oxidoreductase subunit gamma [Elusimicrobiota bacterium]